MWLTDIKPENLMLVADPVAPGGERVKVLDFGIAKLTGERESGAAKTDTHAVMGTPMYMSPEQCSGAGRVDARTDVYALGCVLYQALAGRPPFEAEGAGELIGMHLFQTPKPLAELAPELPQPVTELVHRMLAKDKSQRPDMATTAHETSQLISQLSTGGFQSASTSWESRHSAPQGTPSSQATTIGGTAAQVLPQKRRRQLFILASTGTCAIGAIAVAFYSQQPERSRTPAASPAMSARAGIQPDLSSAPRGAAASSPADLRLAKHIFWRLETQPSEAFVIDPLGTVVGLTPWVHEQDPGTGQTRFRIKLDGYLDTEVFFDHAESSSLSVSLQRKAPTKGMKTPSTAGAPVSKKREIGYEE